MRVGYPRLNTAWDGRDFSIIHISDLHLAERSQDQEDMATAMIAFLDDVICNRIDADSPLKMICVDGDFLDHAIRLYQPSFKAFIMVLSYLIHTCANNDIVLRIMNGTWEHDHGQLRYVTDLKDTMAPDCKLKVIDKIELEHIPELNLRMLYIPDDMPYESSQDIIAVVKEKMQELGWDYVDYACVHGFFDFTVPPVARAAQKVIYEESQFSFVRKLINAGHVHLHQKVGRVISNGNVDFTRFGETGPKGAVLVRDQGEDGATSRFLVNQYAAPYVTLTYDESKTTQEITADITAAIKAIVTTRLIHLRVLIENKDIRTTIRTWLLDTYPHILSKVAAPPRDASKTSGEDTTALCMGVTLPPMPTPDNLADYVYHRISAKDGAISQDEVTWALKTKAK